MNSNTLSLNISAHEKALIKDIEKVGYGEIYDIRLPKSEGPLQIIKLSQECYTLIRYLRAVSKIDTLKIHNGKPQIAETASQTELGMPCLIKKKF